MKKIFLLNFLAVIVGLTSSIFFSTSAIAAIKAPTNVVATAGDGKVSISFTPSVVTAGESIVEYVAYTGGSDATRGGYYYEGKSATSPVVVVDLPNNFEYRFKVYARGKGAQNSPDSSYSKIVIPKTGSTTTTPPVDPVVKTVGCSDTKINPGSGGPISIIDSTTPSTFGAKVSGRVLSSVLLRKGSDVTYVYGPKPGKIVQKTFFAVAGEVIPRSDFSAYCMTFTAEFKDLKPETEYQYLIYVNHNATNFNGINQPVPFTFKTLSPVAPSAPQNVRATAGNELATITFNPPESDGGSPVTGYSVVVVSEGLADRYVEFKNAKSLTITQLENDVEVVFKIAAKNKYGTGPYAVSNPVIPVGPDSGVDLTGGEIEPEDVDPSEISRHFQINNPLKSSSFEEFLAKILDALVLILTPILVLMLVICGFLFVKAQGNAEQLGVAKKALLGTLIGSTLVLGAHVISNLLENTFSQF